MGHRIGLEYVSVPIVCESLGIVPAEVFTDLQFLELSYLSEAK
jgi:hypothetical protein